VSGAPRPGAPGRTAEEIRRDIDLQQAELASSMVALRTRVNELTDWRRQLDEHRDQLIKGAAIAGFVIGGMMALKRRRRNRA
jgi:DNA-binding transcriptional MerR regulator